MERIIYIKVDLALQRLICDKTQQTKLYEAGSGIFEVLTRVEDVSVFSVPSDVQILPHSLTLFRKFHHVYNGI